LGGKRAMRVIAVFHAMLIFWISFSSRISEKIENMMLTDMRMIR